MPIKWNPLAPTASLLRAAGVPLPNVSDFLLEEMFTPKPETFLPTEGHVAVAKKVTKVSQSEVKEGKQGSRTAEVLRERSRSSLEKFIDKGGSTGSRHQDYVFKHRSSRRRESY